MMGLFVGWLGVALIHCGLTPPAQAWEHIGPHNLFDDKTNRGESGTLADAASPASNPALIYTGGSNNGASSGILKTSDGGLTWQRKSKGLYDTRVYAVVLPSNDGGAHVLAGTPSGIYESTDFAETWALLTETTSFGIARSIRVGNISGTLSVLASAGAGIASTPLKPSLQQSKWTVAPYPKGNQGGNVRFTLAQDATGNAVLGSCIRMNNSDAAYAGEGFIGAYNDANTIDWVRPGGNLIRCATLGIHPKNPQHFIYSNSTWGSSASVLHNTWGSFDGGTTLLNLGHPTEAFHVAMDGQGWLYTGAEAGAFWSTNNGTNWSAFVVNMTSPGGEVTDRIPHDYQGISTGFAGDGVAFPSDQGLFVKPPGQPETLGATVPLINTNGNMSNNIAIKMSVSSGDGSTRYFVTSMWDWGPVASWDGGNSWPIGDWNPHGHNDNIATDHDANAMTLTLLNEHNQSCNSDFDSYFWIRHDALTKIGIPLDSHGSFNCGDNAAQHCGSIVVNGGANLSLQSINPSNGVDVCGYGGCPLAFLNLEQGESMPQGLKPGSNVTISWSPYRAPTPPPTTPAPTPPRYPSGGSPDRFGEGGGSHGLGQSNYVIMIHYDNIYFSSQGGQNLSYFTNKSAPGASGLPPGAVAHQSNLVFARQKGSRSIPAGPVYTVMTAPSPAPTQTGNITLKISTALDRSSFKREDRHLSYTSYGEISDHPKLGSARALELGSSIAYILRSPDFGKTWNWAPLPQQVQSSRFLAINPQDASTLYAVSNNCLSSSSDGGTTWGPCSKAPGIQNSNLVSLYIKDSNVMLLLRADAVPLRTKDGGKTWNPLNTFPNVSMPSYSRSGSYSWSGNTFVVYGRDAGAPARNQFPTYVYATTDDGDSWVDWVEDLVTMSPSSCAWWDKDFYLSSAGEGIMVKHNAEV